jgi:hypothetical protein
MKTRQKKMNKEVEQNELVPLKKKMNNTQKPLRWSICLKGKSRIQNFQNPLWVRRNVCIPGIIRLILHTYIGSIGLLFSSVCFIKLLHWSYFYASMISKTCLLIMCVQNIFHCNESTLVSLKLNKNLNEINYGTFNEIEFVNWIQLNWIKFQLNWIKFQLNLNKEMLVHLIGFIKHSFGHEENFVARYRISVWFDEEIA